MCSNWGLTEHELTTIPPSLVRGFMKSGRGGFGSDLPAPFGRLLMRGEFNSELYGPLQGLYEEGWKEGTDVWIHKNHCQDRGPIKLLWNKFFMNKASGTCYSPVSTCISALEVCSKMPTAEDTIDSAERWIRNCESAVRTAEHRVKCGSDPGFQQDVRLVCGSG